MRRLVKHKAFSLINILGLSIGMASTMLILLWIYNERTWDHAHTNYSSIYQVMNNRNFNGEISTGTDMMFPLEKAARENFGEVEAATNVSFGETTLFSVGDKKLNRNTVTVTPDFFKVFTYETLHGNTATALSDPDGVILTESTARALFGQTEVLGKEVEVNNYRTAMVRAVIRDVPRNSTLQFEGIIPVNPSSPEIKQAENEWVNCNQQLFFKMAPGADVAGLEKKVIELIRKRTGRENPTTRGSILLHPMKKWRLYSDFEEGKNTGGRIEYVNLFSTIAVIILIIACVNFMNLSTAKSEKRAREVGIRKTLGSDRKQLLLQFLAESMLIALFAFLVALLIVGLTVPSFERILNEELVIPYQHPGFWLLSLSVIFITGLLAGSYPAFYLSGFNPVKVLKGTFLSGKKGMIPRKVLVTFQFIVSIVLISATLIIYRQLQYVKDRDLGYNQEKLIMVNSSADSDKSFSALRNDLLQSGMVASVNRTSGPMTNILMYTSGINWVGSGNRELIIGFSFAAEDFAKTMQAKVFAGRDFAQGDSNRVIFNREAIRLMGLKDPVGKEITWAGRSREIVGVIDNLVMTSPYEPATPLMLAYEDKWSGRINIRLSDHADVSEAIDAVGKIYKKYSAEYPFEYRFVDEDYQQKFNTEKLISQLSVILASIAIFICCLGLFGLVATSIERRTKEIGIRKVLGASVQGLLFLISREFLVLVLIAFAIAIPAAWWGMNKWLQNFSYRIDISIWLFFLVGFALLFIVALTIGLNASRAALNSPVRSLRTE
ncbi:MAG TPA: ABC transporter permease [Sphingobacteriaceae bacterium]